MAKTKFPAGAIRWRKVKSSNVVAVGWDEHYDLYVKFRSGGTYVYVGVTRQRVVAMTRAESVGKYLNEKIKPHFPAVKLA